jgi:hypothetical protein
VDARLCAVGCGIMFPAWAELKPEPKSPPAPTQWVEQATDVIDADFPRFDQLPKHLSIDSLTQQELDELRKALYEWAIKTRELSNAESIAQAGRSLARGELTREKYDVIVARQKTTNYFWGCWNFLYKKINGKQQPLPVGFKVFVPIRGYTASALKVNGVIRHGFDISAENTINSSAAFWLDTQRPLAAAVQGLDFSRWYDKRMYEIYELQEASAAKNFLLAAFGEFVPEKEWGKYKKDKVPNGVQIDKTQTQCSLIATSCRVYSFKVDRLKWTNQFDGGIPRNHTKFAAYELVKSQGVNDEFALEDTCPGSNWGAFQKAGPGISRGFGQTISRYYENWINTPFLIKRSTKDAATVADQLKPFVKVP